MSTVRSCAQGVASRMHAHRPFQLTLDRQALSVRNLLLTLLKLEAHAESK